MEVICLQEEAFFALFDKVVEHIEQKQDKTTSFKWIDGEEAMEKLNISSKTTLQKLRDQGKIRYTQPQPRVILYDINSLEEYLELHARETF
ncbi:MAG: helix-turn-helix domain-containing protein [Bacteroidota bacterium]